MSKRSVCGCCDGLSLKTPVKIYNRPGLSEIAYRAGKHPQFKASLLTRISGSGGELSELTTREDKDFTIALLDSWAVVSDILTFYQERIANESFLRTATERFSIQELARMIGYELSPGVSASTYLSFTIEDTPGAMSPSLSTLRSFEEQGTIPPVTIEEGLKVQSIPGPKEKVQVFETIETIEARAEWNAIRPRTKQPTKITPYTEVIYLAGLSESINRGDIVLLNTDDGYHPRSVIDVVRDGDEDHTRVTLKVDIDGTTIIGSEDISDLGKKSDFDVDKTFNSDVAGRIFGQTWTAGELNLLIKSKNWSEKSFVKSQKAFAEGLIDQKVDIYRHKAFVFGYNAPSKFVDPNGDFEPPFLLEDWDLNESADKLFLDSIYEGIKPGSIILVQDQSVAVQDALPLTVGSVQTTARSAYGISSKTSLLSLNETEGNWKSNCTGTTPKLSCIRDKLIHVQNDPLTLIEEPIETDISGSEITLDGLYFGLKDGQKIMITGKMADLTAVVGSELATIKEVFIDHGFTRLILEHSLEMSYVRSSVIINANVAFATHGETVVEILGSGDATIPFQKFVLKQPPLTYINSEHAGGTETTLEVRVNDILWAAVPFFTSHGPDERIYTVRQRDDGKTTITFGDGITGARLPTGRENVKATYRKGTGTDGLLDAYRLTQLMSRPLGVKAVENLLPAEGAADPENASNARKNAPLTVLTLDRIVTLQDYEDYSRAFAGIDKALAKWVWKNQKRWIHLTIAGTKGAILPPGNIIHDNLMKSLRNYGNPRVSILIDSFTPRFFKIEFSIEVLPEFLAEKVSSAVDSMLHQSFSFENREFGQPVWRSEVITLIQQIDGVKSVDLNALYFSENDVSLEDALPASLPHYENNVFTGAELIMIDPQPVIPVIIS